MNYTNSKTKQFCKAFLRFCKRVADCNRNRKFVYAANEAVGDDLIDSDAPDFEIAANEGETWHVIPYGDYPHKVGTQRLDVNAANLVVNNFNSRLKTLLGRLGFGTVIPVYLGHPDIDANGKEGISDKHLDQTQYGKLTEVAARPEGLALKIELNSEASRLPKGLTISPFWKMRPIGNRIYRIEQIKSIGLTSVPNIKNLGAANEADSAIENFTEPKNQEKESRMNNDMLIKLGYTADQATAYLNKGANAPSDSDILAKITTLADQAATATTLSADLKTAQTAAANSLDSYAEHVVNSAIARGIITEADRAKTKESLVKADNFVDAANALEAKEPVVKTTSTSTNAPKPDDVKAAKKKFNDCVAENEKAGCKPAEAWNKAKKSNPDIYKLAFGEK